MTHNNVKARLLPFSVIQKAAGGDVEAINAVLKHYEGYIARLSLRELYDEYGNPHLGGRFFNMKQILSADNAQLTPSFVQSSLYRARVS